MKKLYRFLLFSAMLLPAAVFGQITYTFDVDGNGYTSDGGTTYTNMTQYPSTGTGGTFENLTLSALGAATGGDGNTTIVFHGKTRTNNTASVDLTAISSANDQQLVWKTYLKTATTITKGVGVILRAQTSASGYSASARRGYFYTCYGTGTSGSVKFRVGKLDATAGYVNIKSETTQAIGGFTNGPLYLKAKAVGSLLYFEYSTDGSTYTAFPGSPYTDATYSSGTVQLAWGLGSGSGLDQYYDDVTFTDLTVHNPVVSMTGNDKFVYTGAAQGPASSTNADFSGAPTVTYSYEGIGATVYSASSTAPTNAGTYKVTVTGTYTPASQTATDVMAFEILPNTYEKVYTFNDDAVDGVAANTSYTLSSQIVSTFAASTMLGVNTKGKYLKPTGNGTTTLTQFGLSNATAGNYSVVWKDYATTTTQKRAIILRGDAANTFQTINNNTVNVGRGYLFYVNNTTATNLQLDIRKINISADPTTLISAVTNTVAATQNTAIWYRATANGSTLTFEYSTDAGASWITGCTTTDATYSSGVTQITSINSGGASWGIDFIAFDNLSSTPAVVLEQSDMYTYTGTAQGPSTSTHYNFTSAPTVTVTYEGIGGTTYASSSTAPTLAGNYLATASATYNAETATDVQAFEIISASAADQFPYVYNTHTLGNMPAGITYPLTTSNIVNSGTVTLCPYQGTSSGNKSTALMIKPLTPGTANGTGVINLTSIPSSTNYSVIWKEYCSSIIGQKKGMLLQGQVGETAYTTGLKQGSLFIVYNDDVSGNTILRIYNVTASATLDTYSQNAGTIAGATAGSPRWYRASVANGSQRFEYSDDGTNWTVGVTSTYTTYTGLTGNTQLVYGLGSSNIGTFYYDYIGYSANSSTFSKVGSSNWSTATEWTKTPTSTTDLIVASGELIVDQNTLVNSITLNPGARLTLNDGFTLETTRAFTIQGNETANGTLVDKNADGGLTIGGAPTVQQYLTGTNSAGTPNGRFWYLTSPIKGATKANSGVFTASGANKLWSYNEAGGATVTNVYTEITDDATELTPGNGYVVRLADPITASFTGSAFVTGSTNVPFSYTPATGKPGFNLVGNPYPSYLNIASALASASDLETSIWNRSHNTTTGTMVFDTYNATSKIPVINSGRTDLTDFVPPMQAIWVKAKTTSGNIVLTNAMRSHQPTGNLLRSANTQQSIIRLNVSNGMNTDQTVISFNPEASDEFDNFDSRKMFNGIDSLPEIYTLAGALSVAINGMAPFEGNKELALGFKTAKAGTFSIKAYAFTNLDDGQTVILNDKLLNVSQNLNILPEYSFTSEATTTTDRFSVVISKMATNLDANRNSNFNARGIRGGQIEINLAGSQATKVEVYDMLGKMIHTEKMKSETSILDKTFGGGLYLVKINGGMRKVIIND